MRLRITQRVFGRTPRFTWGAVLILALGAPAPGPSLLATGGTGALAATRAEPHATAHRRALKPRTLAEFGWGAGPRELGRNRPVDGNPEAPMSLAAARNGDVVILDQVNQRTVRVDPAGRRLGAQALPLRAPQDVAMADDGSTLLLDRLVDKSVAIVAATGLLLGRLPIEGRGLLEGGAATGVFVDGDTIYVEREHGALVAIGRTNGQVDSRRAEVPGRPTRDGRAFIRAARVGARTVALTVFEHASKARRFVKRYTLPTEVRALALLDSDASGRVYLGALAVDAASPTGSRVSVLCLDPTDGRTVGRLDLAANDDADETFRELAVPRKGGVLQLRRTEPAAALRWAACGPP